MGAGISVGTLALTGVSIWRLLQTPVSLASFLVGAAGFLSLFATILFGYWTFSCWRLRYALDDASLAIYWGPVKHVIPLTFIERAFSGDEVDGHPRVRGLNWAGYHVGWAKLGSVGTAVFYSTHLSSREIVYVVTPGLSYAISPPNPAGFMAHLHEFKQRFSGPLAKPKAERWFFLRLPIWTDRNALGLMLAGLVVNAALFAYVTYFFPSLPELLPMHFTVLGEVDLIGFRNEVLKLPAMAFVVYASNVILATALHANERLAAYLCLVAAFFVQVVFWVATVRIVY